ncbi:hypothetical protein D9M68_736370 [compost metagenome]
MDQAGIAITGTGIAVPGHQARHRVQTAMESHLRLLPGRFFEQLFEPAVRAHLIQPLRLKIQLGVRQLQVGVGK